MCIRDSYIRYHWTSDSAVNSTATFTTTYSTLTIGAGAAGSDTATPTTVLTRAAGGARGSSTVNDYAISRPGYLAPLATGPFAFQTFAPDSQAIVLNCAVSSLTLADITTSFVYLYGVELLYTPKYTFGDGSRREARYVNPPLSDMEAGPAGELVR